MDNCRGKKIIEMRLLLLQDVLWMVRRCLHMNPSKTRYEPVINRLLVVGRYQKYGDCVAV